MIQFIKKILGFVPPQRITQQQIAELPPAKLCQKFIDGELESDPESEIFNTIMCAVELHAEVVNGGFNQYYYNTDGERAETARSTFARLGADQIADLVKRANLHYNTVRDHLQTVWEDRTMQSFSRSYKEKYFDAFDDEYYALMKNNKQLYELIGKYIKQHPQEFLTKPTE